MVLKPKILFNARKGNLLILLLVAFVIQPAFSQNGVAINTTGTTANASAMLDVSSTTAGVLIPRMKLTERNAIGSPAVGLLIYQTDNTPGFYYYNGTAWTLLGGSGSGSVNSVTATSPLASSGGTNPNISISSPVPIANGGTNGTAAPTKGGIAYGTGTAYDFSAAGTSGQVLTSNGTGAPTWSNISLGQSAITVYGTSPLTLAANPLPSYTLIPGLTTSINIPLTGTYFVYVATDGGIGTTSTAPDGFSACNIAIFIDNNAQTNGGFKQITALNNASMINNVNFWSMSLTTSLSAGTHTISVRAASAGYGAQSSTVIGGSNTTILQPELSVLLIKQ